MKNMQMILKGGCALILAFMIASTASAQLENFDVSGQLGALGGPGTEIIIDKRPVSFEASELTAGKKAGELDGFRLAIAVKSKNDNAKKYSGKLHMKLVLSTKHGLTAEEASALTSKDPSTAIVLYDKGFTVPPSGGATGGAGTRLLGIVGAARQLTSPGASYDDILTELTKQLNKRLQKAQQLTVAKEDVYTVKPGAVTAMNKMLSKKTSLYMILTAPGKPGDTGKLTYTAKADMALAAVKTTSG